MRYATKEGIGPCKCYATYFVAHITASVFINDDERGLYADYEDWLEELAPYEPTSRYRHNRTGGTCPEAPPERVEGRGRRNNGDAHLKRQVRR